MIRRMLRSCAALLLICATSWTTSPSDDPPSTSGGDAHLEVAASAGAAGAAGAADTPAAAPAVGPPDLRLPDLAGLTPAEIEQTVTAALQQLRAAWIAAHNAAVRSAVAGAVQDAAAATIRDYQPRLDGAEAALAEAQAQLDQCQAGHVLGRLQAAILGVGLGWIGSDLLPAP